MVNWERQNLRAIYQNKLEERSQREEMMEANGEVEKWSEDFRRGEERRTEEMRD